MTEKVSPRLDIGRLPIPGKVFVGRQKELKRLDDAWADASTHVVTLVAFGGVGKSALVARWLGQMAADGWRGARRVLDWSFYSQGSEERVASADGFIDYALRFFGDEDPTKGSPHDRGRRLAELVRKEKTLLVLDGVEPLQYPPGRPEVAGRLKDPGLAALLKGLAAGNPGLCVVTTRERVADLAGWEQTAPQVDLEKLEPEAAVELLKALGVDGSEKELGQAVDEFQRHALTLTLLGSYLRRAHNGDVRKRKEISLREVAVKAGGHAGRVVAAYCRWLGDGPEVAILRLLGFFDRPADAASIQALRATPVIKGLTEDLVGLSKEDWRSAVTTLRDHGLVAEADPSVPDTLDCHPLVRSYFAEVLERKEQIWVEGNLRLYQHLCQAAPDLPETLEEMQPLYAAILHGCRAGRQQELMIGVYWRRILRGSEHFSLRNLGTFGSDLTALAGFFDHPWSQPSTQLTANWQAFVLNQVAANLRALGRLAEAIEPTQASLQARLGQKIWQEGAAVANNLTELTLALGDVPRAVAFGEKGVELADRSGDAFRRIVTWTTWADARHQAGQWQESAAAFHGAEAIQAEWQPEYPRLYSVRGFRYCDLLLGLSEPETGAGLDGLAEICSRPEQAESLRQVCREMLERARQTLDWFEDQYPLLDIALSHLTLGRSALYPALLACHNDRAAGLAQAADHLSLAVEGLRRAAQEDHLPRGLLARAALRRFLPDHPGAEADLAEALEIAERGGMRLFECDAHLELARLRRDQGLIGEARRHWARARELVTATGYGRREREVVWLEKELQKEARVKDFFVSFNSKDRAWADWIAWTLEEAGFSVVYQPWDFRPGANFVLEMQKAASEARKTVMVLSDNYLRADYTQPEWAAAFVDDPRGEKRKLIPLRVAPCSPTGMLKTLIWEDLVGLTPDAAKEAVLAAVRAGRAKPPGPPMFPGVAGIAGRRSRPGPPYPVAPLPVGNPKALALWSEKLAFLEQQEALAVEANQKFALLKQIEEARRKVREYGG
ncbi:MAG: TIR domain-containing protein [Thermoanaerobaculia bacterium]|nr:TIR domain-containing protein [Thermoanaerobaculia bacterium]